MSSLSDDTPVLVEELVATKPEDGMSAYVANPEGVEWSPPTVDKILTKEEIYKILDELRLKDDTNLLPLPEQYCADRGIDFEDYHKADTLADSLKYNDKRRELMRDRLRKKLADKKKNK
jgi:iron only hydrogenase large subunit-like protein